MIISRNIINKDISFTYKHQEKMSTYDFTAISMYINRVKRTLLEKGAKKGDKVLMCHTRIDLFHLSAVIASAELGMQLIVTDMPTTEEALPYTKVSLYGPVEFTFYDGVDFRDRPYKKMAYTYSKTVIKEEDISADSSSIETPWEVNEQDILLITSSSGTTSWSKRIDFTHQDIYEVSFRCIDLGEYKKSDKVAHNKNLHHGASMFVTFLPALMVCDQHYGFFFPDYKNYYKYFVTQIDDMIEDINRLGINRFMITSPLITDLFFKSVSEKIGRFETTLTIMTHVYMMEKKLIDLCIDFNVEFITSFGASEIKGPLALNRVTKNSELINNCIGKIKNDGFYEYDIDYTNGRITVNRSNWDIPVTLQDRFEFLENGNVVHVHREPHIITEYVIKLNTIIPNKDYAVVINGEDVYLALFEDIADINIIIEKGWFKNIIKVAKEIFYCDNKINYDALRGHFIYYDQNKV